MSGISVTNDEPPEWQTNARDLSDMLRAFARLLRGNALTLLAWALFCLGVTTAYLALTPANYVAAATIELLPPKGIWGLQQKGGGSGDQSLDKSRIDSEVLVIQSKRVLQFVFEILHLDADPEFKATSHSMLSLTHGLGWRRAEAASGEALAFEKFSSRVFVQRIGQSYVVEIKFRSRSADRAARMANSIVAAYFHDHIATYGSAMQDHGEWLQARVDDLQMQEAASLESIRNASPLGNLSAADARVLSSASPPLYSSNPSVPTALAFALLFSLVSGITGLTLSQFLNDRIRTKEDLQALGLRCLGDVPKLSDGEASNLIKKSATNDMFATTLRSIGLAISKNAKCKTPFHVGVLSVDKGAGKTTIAVNLAHALLANELCPLLIDADFPAFSLTKTLLSQADLVRHNEAGFVRTACGLWFVPGDKAAAPSVQSHTNVAREFAIARHKLAIVDLPTAAASHIDLVAPPVDAAIIVVEAGKTKLSALTELLQDLCAQDVKLLGAVLNKVEDSQVRSDRFLRLYFAKLQSSPIFARVKREAAWGWQRARTYSRKIAARAEKSVR